MTRIPSLIRSCSDAGINVPQQLFGGAFCFALMGLFLFGIGVMF